MSETFYHNLPNGVQIVHRKTSSPVVYVGIMVGAGTRHEQANENGMAHYIEHCVFKGTEHYTARQIINHIEGIGGEINAYTTKEETTFYAATLSNHFRTTLHLLADMVMRPTFNKKETDKEVTVILDEIESYISKDEYENLIKRRIGNMINKTRINVPIENGFVVEIDIYYDYLEGLITAEIEFPDEETAELFKKPDWLGEELGYKNFSNGKLSLMDREQFMDKVTDEFMQNNKIIIEKLKKLI